MARKKVLIIGGGIAGLAAGTYLQMNGYETQVFESHKLPGGLCTAWTRKGYTFDYCIHWLMGSGPAKNLHKIWQDLGAIKDRTYVEWEEYITITLQNKQTFTVFTDPDKLFKEMVRLSPQDEKICKSFCNAIKELSGFDFPINRGEGGFFKTLGSMTSLLMRLPLLLKWARTPMPAFIQGLKGPDLQAALRQIYTPEIAQDFPVAGLIMMLAFMYKKSAGYPLGGSLAFAKAIEKRYCSLGGKVNYGCFVDKILVQEGRATGIQANKQEISGDIVISAADGHTTLFTMLEGKFLTEKLTQAYENLQVFPSLVYVCIGIKRDLRSVPSMQSFPVSKPIMLEDAKLTLDKLSLRLYHFDPSSAPVGAVAAIVMIPTFNTSWWTTLKADDPAKYQAEKARVGAEVVDAIDSFLGDIKSNVEVIDVATPATVIRYTHNWKGSFEGFLPTGKNMMSNGLGNSIPGLKNFYMVGQWVHPGGGLPPCGMDGLAIAQKLCKEDHKKFRIAAQQDSLEG
jgi:phytoene dehydrogenase-like protein